MKTLVSKKRARRLSGIDNDSECLEGMRLMVEELMSVDAVKNVKQVTNKAKCQIS